MKKSNSLLQNRYDTATTRTTNGSVRAIITFILSKSMYIFINKRNNNSFTADSNLTQMYHMYKLVNVAIMGVFVTEWGGPFPMFAEKAVYNTY
jgi:hypothetical protein